MSARADAGYRLRRLLAVLGWLDREGEASVEDLAARFGAPADELVADLELAACCGLPPYTPDELLEVVVEGDRVAVRAGPRLPRARRLTAAQGLALAAAARAILAVPGADDQGALARATEKLEAALGRRGTVVIDVPEPEALPLLRAVLAEAGAAEIDYWSASQDERTTRVVEPRQVVLVDGQWYVDAWCRRAGGERRFRVDRILRADRIPSDPGGGPSVPGGSESTADAGAADSGNAESTPEQTHLGRGAPDATVSFLPGPEDIVAELRVAAPGLVVLEGVPTLSVEPDPEADADPEAEDRFRVRLAVANEAWFGRLLLRLGPALLGVEPPELARAGRDAAHRILRRYQEGAPSPA